MPRLQRSSKSKPVNSVSKGSCPTNPSKNITKRVVTSTDSATTMKTTARHRAAPALPRAGGAKKLPATNRRVVANRKPVARRAPAAATATATGAKKPTTFRKRFAPPPPPPVYWICYDFTQKLMRGLCLGIAIGLVLTIGVPWLFDVGFDVKEKVEKGDIALPDLQKLGSDLAANLPSWNETSKRLWRVDQSEGRTSYLRYEKPTSPPTLDPRTAADMAMKMNFPKKNRTFTLVHVGHTGGYHIMHTCPTLLCKDLHPRDDAQVESCVQQQLQIRQEQQRPLTPLERQAQYYFHLGSVKHDELQQSTSFLFTLRNPVDRILATFRDAHPLSCPLDSDGRPIPMPRPHGCDTMNYYNMPDTQQYSFYSKCFPQVDPPEIFAQAVTSPWINISGEERLVNTIEQQHHDCRWMAREAVTGKNTDLTPLAPHMHYNYEFYAEQSLWKYPGHEVFVLRAEHEHSDLASLEALLIDSAKEDPSKFQPIPDGKPVVTPEVSTQAYGKLCCVLEKEIDIYESILRKAINFPLYVKDDTMENLRQKCGLPEELGWSEWRVRCRERTEMDSVLLTP